MENCSTSDELEIAGASVKKLMASAVANTSTSEERVTEETSAHPADAFVSELTSSAASTFASAEGNDTSGASMFAKVTESSAESTATFSETAASSMEGLASSVEGACSYESGLQAPASAKGTAPAVQAGANSG